MKENKKDKAGIITKASASYSDMSLLRTAIQLSNPLGGALDKLLSLLGEPYQQKRFQHFIIELDARLKRIEESINIEPSEPLHDLMMQVFNDVIKTRSEEKRKYFANLITNQVVNDHVWDDAETACRLLADLTDMHIKILQEALKAPKCEAYNNQRIILLTNYYEGISNGPTDISPYFPELHIAVLKMACSELIAKGLLHDAGIGGYADSGGAMELFRATEMAQWLMDWIAEPKESA
ncbi:MAG: hypothetical protein FVQ82_02030 [Planctomycetes bacterium]|nr:hypothetical protein [Planctomycetota bacterium]